MALGGRNENNIFRDISMIPALLVLFGGLGLMNLCSNKYSNNLDKLNAPLTRVQQDDQNLSPYYFQQQQLQKTIDYHSTRVMKDYITHLNKTETQ